MASGTLTGDESREKRRWGENKFYTRKKHKKEIEENNEEKRTNHNDSAVQESLQTLATTTEDGNLTKQQQQPRDLSRLDGGSDDSSCKIRPEVTKPNDLKTINTNGSDSNQLRNPSQLNGGSEDSSYQDRAKVTMPNNFDLPDTNGWKSVFTRFENRVKINVTAARSKSEFEEVKKKLETELEQIRSSLKKLVAKEVQLNQYSVNEKNSDLQVIEVENYGKGEAPVMMNSEVASVGQSDSRPFHGLSVVVTESYHDGNEEIYDKDKWTPMSNQYYPKSNLQYPVSNKKKLKPNGFGLGIQLNKALKSCSNLLARLIKHKHSWVFKAPVDAKALNLHDYHDIIKHPMDLGTIRTKLTKRRYNSPREFAKDVRLTFNNAMTYNPKGHEVYTMAEDFLKIFEEKWAVIEAEFDLDQISDMTHDMGLPTPASRVVPPPHRPLHAPPPSTVVASTDVSFHGPVRNVAQKKSKAKNPHKRDMTFEEKEKLGMELQSFPSEKLDDIVQIIKKHNSGLSQHDDEIELDIDCLDAETLWELDKLVSDYKKSLSKNKRKSETALETMLETEQADQNMNPEPVVMVLSKEVREDVENVPVSIVEDKQEIIEGKPRSPSISSSNSGSSSSDSDSDSSSSSSGSDQGHSPRT